VDAVEVTGNGRQATCDDVLISLLVTLCGVVRARGALHVETLVLRLHLQGAAAASAAPGQGRPVAL